VRAVIASEDAKFCEHHGFDWDAIGEAWRRYRRGEGKLRGASTISMQTAKNVFLWPGRDWLRKGFEAYFTVLIELAWGKERIVENYLNVVEWGPGIYGAEAASQFHFHKPSLPSPPTRRPASPRCCRTRSNGRRAGPTATSPGAPSLFARRCPICRCHPSPAAGSSTSRS
jgi:membrane peptidoglycan carboxypeptidase